MLHIVSLSVEISEKSILGLLSKYYSEKWSVWKPLSFAFLKALTLYKSKNI